MDNPPLYPFETFFRNKLCSSRNRACAKGFFLFAVLSYLYFVTHDLNNYDTIGNLIWGYGAGVSSGRWFLQLLGDSMHVLELDYTIPFFNVLIALTFVYFAACFVIHILHIENSVLCFGIGAITASFPTIAASMFFPHTVHYYFFGLFLGVAGVYLAQQNRWYCIFSVVLFALSLGIYQAYYPFIAVMFVLALIQKTLDLEVDWKYVIRDAFIYLLFLILGYLLYRVLNQYFLSVYETVLNDYQGISSMGQLNLRDLPHLIKETYKNYFFLYQMDYCSISATHVIRFCIAIIFALVFLFVVLDWKKRTFLKNIELCVLLCILPVASNSIIIMVPNGDIYTLMVLGLIALFYLPILMAQNLKTSIKSQLALILLTCIITLLASTNYAYQSNGNYRSLYYQNRMTENYYSILFSRIKSCEGYQEDMEIVLLGSNIDDSSFSDSWHKYVFRYGGKDSHVMNTINAYSRADFMRRYFGYTVRDATESENREYAPYFIENETYPNSGSIKIIDNIVLVNCG